MTSHHRPTLMVAALCVAAALASASTRNTVDRSDKIRRGDYLTHHVAMCVQCHSPRDEKGNILLSEEFIGAPIPIRQPVWAPNWAFASVNIRGLPGWSDDEAIHFLETGQRYNGSRPQGPMPPFRLSREDAEAVVAYLKSLQ